MVFPGGEGDLGLDTYREVIFGNELNREEIDAIKRARGVDTVLEMPFTVTQVRWQSENEMVFIWGIDMERGLEVIRDDMGWYPREGSFPRPGRREVVLGHLVSRNIFPGIEVGDEISIEGRRYTVSGILRSLGHRENDTTILFHLPDYREVTGTRDGTPVAIVRIEEGFDLNVAVGNIEMSLEEMAIRRRGVMEESSYTVVSSEAMMELIETILGTIQGVIMALSGVAILVGAVGIMNSMFTSVKQRTKEVGILKAVGARRRDIINVFLVESGIIGFLGGVIGLILGLSAAYIGGVIISQSPEIFVPIEAQTPIELIFGALLFSFLLGCLSGYLPARKAANLNPVDALMYE